MCTSLGEFDEYDNYTIDLADSPLLRHLDLGEATFISDHGELTYFGYHTQLESLILPQGISSILASGEYEAGFSRSDMLKTLIIPEGVKILRGVIDCPNLVELNIPQSVEQIDSFAFAGGSSITSIRLPRNLNSIDGSSFAGCNISRFELDSENPNFVEVDGVIFSKDLTRLVAFPSSYPHAKYQIPNTTKVIGWGAFMDSMINELIIPDSVETIEGWAFQGSKISTIVIPDSVKTIGELAFRWCDRLTCLKLSNSITEIPAQLISGCLSLKRIEIPGNVKKVDISALAWSYNLKEIIFHSGVEEISGCGPMLIKPSNLQRVVIPSTLKKIPGGAFSYSTNRYVFDVDSRNPYFTVKDGALYSKDCKRLISIPDRRRRKFELINEVLPKVELFTQEELQQLDDAQELFRQHLSEMSELEYRKEMERLGIELSWKSSQIEGNTYSLLETERLLKEKQTASGKTKEEAVMLLNHKDALDFILDVPDYLKDLTVARIEEIHALLTKELGVERNIRHRRVGITGTNYTPLDNEFQIREALEDTVRLINDKSNIFEKALLALVLLSYIQAFTDGNKRSARIVSNGILIANGYCPISFRTVDSIDYKKAMLMFDEQNNIAAFKRIFIDQFLFAVKTYF